MDDLEEEEDVIIEGSELHRALVNMGYTDFESTPINNNGSAIENDFVKKPSGQNNYKWREMLCNFFKSTFFLNGMLVNTPKTCYLSMKQLAMILKMECLLDDHAEVVQSLINKNSKSSWSQFSKWWSLTASSLIIGLGYLMSEKKKTLATFVGASLAALSMCRKYEEFLSIRALNDLVQVQNELYHLYKKSLGILRKRYRLRLDEKKMQSKFSKLEIDRLKYLQSIMETLLNSMEKVSRMYHYEATPMIVRLLPKKALPDDTLTHFEADAFTIEGEITYDKLRHLYYVYVLVQSDTMQLLAIAYDTDARSDTRMDDERISHPLLTRIIVNLHNSLINHKEQLVRILMEYESCKNRRIERKFRLTTASKWRDLYLNLDLLSRKVQIAYDTIISLLDEMDKHENNETTENDFVTDLAEKTQNIYAQIDKAIHIAEFNNLLVAVIQRSGNAVENSVSQLAAYAPQIGDEGSIVRDSEPEIIDEVFEEYISEEYLKPLYEECDETTLDIAKFDKILAKNFMSELKEVLVDKYKSMSEREARALLRKYRETGEYPKTKENIMGEAAPKLHNEKSILPNSPPLLVVVPTEKQSRTSRIDGRKGKKYHGPVPLPRASIRTQKEENISLVAQSLPVSSLPPPPPAPPPLPVSSAETEGCENTERFSINLMKLGDRKMPAFVTCAEEFIGSGENSEEDSLNSDHEDEASFEGVTKN